VTDEQQAAFLTEAAGIAGQDAYVQGAMYYNLRNNWWSGDGPGLEDQYGLVTSTFDRKPAYDAFRAAATAPPPAPAAKKPATRSASAKRAKAAGKVSRRARPRSKPRRKTRHTKRHTRSIHSAWRIVAKAR
jgi:hypothetical protein